MALQRYKFSIIGQSIHLELRLFLYKFYYNKLNS